MALTPDAVTRLRSAGLSVAVEAGAGIAARYADSAYVAAGADVVSAAVLADMAQVIVCVHPPEPSTLRPGQLLIGVLGPREQSTMLRDWAERDVTALSLDLIPRTLTRAQTMDALTSQASIAGYKAVLVAANAYGAYFPMLTTAAGTNRPAHVLILGVGVAGLQAIATARRLGAIVSAYDVRPDAKTEAESVGARFLELAVVPGAAAESGYARALAEDEQQAQRHALEHHIGRSDVVITTAQVPGQSPPLLVSATAVKGMAPGSVVVDMAAGPRGGNVELSQPDTTIIVDPGVTLIGAGELAASMPVGASAGYARNIAAVLTYLTRDGEVVIDPEDDVQRAMLLTRDGAVCDPDIVAEPPKEGP